MNRYLILTAFTALLAVAALGAAAQTIPSRTVPAQTDAAHPTTFEFAMRQDIKAAFGVPVDMPIPDRASRPEGNAMELGERAEPGSMPPQRAQQQDKAPADTTQLGGHEAA